MWNPWEQGSTCSAKEVVTQRFLISNLSVSYHIWPVGGAWKLPYARKGTTQALSQKAPSSHYSPYSDNCDPFPHSHSLAAVVVVGRWSLKVGGDILELGTSWKSKKHSILKSRGTSEQWFCNLISHYAPLGKLCNVSRYSAKQKLSR